MLEGCVTLILDNMICKEGEEKFRSTSSPLLPDGCKLSVLLTFSHVKEKRTING